MIASGFGHDGATVAYHASTGSEVWRVLDPLLGTVMAIAAAPDGSEVFAGGFGVAAYQSATGAETWRVDTAMSATDMALSTDGATLYVTGATGASPDYVTLALNAATGAELWRAIYDGPGHSTDQANAMEVSPDGSALFVTGESIGVGSGLDYATVAYDAADGSPLWVERITGSGSGYDRAKDVGVSPDSSTVYVTGYLGQDLPRSWLTVAYDAATGATRWTDRFFGMHVSALAVALALSADGSQLYVTGSNASDTGDNYDTLAYDAVTGAAQRLCGLAGPGDDSPTDLAVAGGGVFVTGTVEHLNRRSEYGTMACPS